MTWRLLVLKRMSTAILIMAAMSASAASACTIIWNESDAKRTSDAVVWGTYFPREIEGVGDIKVHHRVKGPKAVRFTVTWDTKWVDDGANCPIWIPDADSPRGRFFLMSNGDGTFSVRAQTPRKKAKN